MKESIALTESNLIISESLWLTLSINFIPVTLINGRLIIWDHWNFSHSPKHLLVEKWPISVYLNSGRGYLTEVQPMLDYIWQYKLDLAKSKIKDSEAPLRRIMAIEIIRHVNFEDLTKSCWNWVDELKWLWMGSDKPVHLGPESEIKFKFWLGQDSKADNRVRKKRDDHLSTP